MTNNASSKAAIPNPKLMPFSILLGEWQTKGNHPMMPHKILHGWVSFKLMEGGAFVIMHSTMEEKEFPDGIAIFGSDDTSEELFMLYFDQREVSRKYKCTLKNNVWKWWRDDPEFSQQFTSTISEDGNSMVSQGEMSKKGKPWENDLELIYTRIA